MGTGSPEVMEVTWIGVVCLMKLCVVSLFITRLADVSKGDDVSVWEIVL